MRSVLVAVLLLTSATSAAKPEGAVDGESPAVVFSRVSNTVVLIRAEGPKGTSQGSGVIVAKDTVVTNLHVVAGATKVTVSFKGREAVGTVSATSKPGQDLALLTVETRNAPRTTFRRSTELAVGERVFAIGNPRGYEQTLTDGLVSALRKEGDAFIVQTSAAISPGSSGGGLFDTRGRLVGVTTQTRVDAQNLNFANPVEWVEALLKSGPSGTPVAVPASWSVSQRPSAALCELTDTSRWGLFSEGLELLESSPTTGSLFISALDTTQMKLEGRAFVLADLSRKSQVALFRGGGADPMVLMSFDDTGDVRVTLATVTDEKGTPRLVTRTGTCEVGPDAQKKAQARVEQERSTPKPSCEDSPAQCYAAAKATSGGERFLLLKKGCKLGHFRACVEGLDMAREVNDAANVTTLEQWKSTATPEPLGSSTPTTPVPTTPTPTTPAPTEVVPGRRKPLGR